ncbi:hypothetical protein HYQ46_006307 [Verticillium longisporum]|nr:hypothetical protein HYQ46_006307 [Verticillium longisporum]
MVCEIGGGAGCFCLLGTGIFGGGGYFASAGSRALNRARARPAVAAVCCHLGPVMRCGHLDGSFETT